MARLGLTQDEMKLLSPKALDQFSKATEALSIARSPQESSTAAGVTEPMAFDVNAILSRSIEVGSLAKVDHPSAWIDLAIPKRSWSATFSDHLVKPNVLKRILPWQTPAKALFRYRKSVGALIKELDTRGVDFAEVNRRAAERPVNERKAEIFPDFEHLVADVRNPEKSWKENSLEAEKLVKILTDRPNRKRICRQTFGF